MIQKLLRIFKLKDLRSKILFVLGTFVIFRLMANIPIPGIDASRLQAFFEGNQLFGLINLFTGGALANLYRNAWGGTVYYRDYRNAAAHNDFSGA